MDLLWILAVTIAFWKLVGRPVHDWFNGFKRVEIRGAHELPSAPPDQPERYRGSREQILELDGDS